MDSLGVATVICASFFIGKFELRAIKSGGGGALFTSGVDLLYMLQKCLREKKKCGHVYYECVVAGYSEYLARGNIIILLEL